jgi:oligopeptide transport system ATP-binding protein
MIQIKNLHLAFKSHHKLVRALRGINLTINEGERIGLVGESGSGKTVLMKAILALLPSYTTVIESGEIVFQGKNLLQLSDHAMQQIRGKEIGIIFQDPMTSLNPTLKIGTQIAESLRKSLRHARTDVAALLARVGIPNPDERIDDYPHTLSGGQRQRVMIAMALAQKPPILIADEPTTALDVTIQAQILDLFKTIEESKTTIFITHDLSLVAGFCDRVIVMYAGEIIEDAPTEELFKNPRHPYTQALLKSIPSLTQAQNKALEPIDGMPPDLSKPVIGCSFAPRCPFAMPICKTKSPPNVKGVRCWLYEEKCSTN